MTGGAGERAPRLRPTKCQASFSGPLLALLWTHACRSLAGPAKEPVRDGSGCDVAPLLAERPAQSGEPALEVAPLVLIKRPESLDPVLSLDLAAGLGSLLLDVRRQPRRRRPWWNGCARTRAALLALPLPPTRSVPRACRPPISSPGVWRLATGPLSGVAVARVEFHVAPAQRPHSTRGVTTCLSPSKGCFSTSRGQIRGRGRGCTRPRSDQTKGEGHGPSPASRATGRISQLFSGVRDTKSLALRSDGARWGRLEDETASTRRHNVRSIYSGRVLRRPGPRLHRDRQDRPGAPRGESPEHALEHTGSRLGAARSGARGLGIARGAGRLDTAARRQLDSPTTAGGDGDCAAHSSCRTAASAPYRRTAPRLAGVASRESPPAPCCSAARCCSVWPSLTSSGRRTTPRPRRRNLPAAPGRVGRLSLR